MEMSKITSGINKKVKKPESQPPPEVKPDDILKPGSKIRPIVSEEDVIKLVERLYGIVTQEIAELKSYDDRNYLIQVDRNVKNPLITKDCPYGYVMKILNSLDTNKVDFIEAQTQLMLYLEQVNIKCPKPLKNVFGKYYSIEELGNTKHLVRLLEYIPGKILYEVPPKDHLFYQAGEFIGKLDNALKNFKHEAYNDHKSVWMLESVPKLEDFIYALKDESKQEIVEDVIYEFNKEIMEKLDTFEKGMIHGDFNEHNILVNKVEDGNEYRITGILDFGDTCYSYYVFELAIAMAYMMLQTKNLATGGLVLAGYSTVRTIPEHEKKVLKLCTAARLCQSLVMGQYTHTLDPTNEYILSTQKSGWALLEAIWKQPTDELEQLWAEISDNYLKQSYK